MSNWKGTAVPNSGIVKKVYINTKLSVEEVENIVKQLTYLNVDGNLIYVVLSDETFETTISIEFYDNQYQVSYKGIPILNTSLGWLEHYLEEITNYDFNITAVSDSPFGVLGAENDKLSSLFSITPFVEVEEIKKKRKNILMHPTKEDGTLDTNTDLYPRTTVENLLTKKGGKYTIPNVVYQDGLYVTNEDGTPNFDKPISVGSSGGSSGGSGSGGGSEVLSYEAAPHVIDDSKYYKDKVVYCEEGIPVTVLNENYHYVDNIFFNSSLSKAEVTKILDKLKLGTDENPSNTYYVYYCYSDTNLAITKLESGAYEITIDGWVVWNSLNGFNNEIKENNYNFLNKPSGYSFYTGEVDGSYASIYNDRLKELFSIIPYQKVEQSFKVEFTPVPVNKSVNKIYVDSRAHALNILRDIIPQLQFVKMSEDDLNQMEVYNAPNEEVYVVYSDENARNMMCLFKYDDYNRNYSDVIPQYIVLMKKDGYWYEETTLWNLIQPTKNLNEDSLNIINELSNLNVEFASEIIINGNKYPVGQSNDILSIFSSTPLKYSKVFKAVPTTVPNSGFVEKIYINNKYNLQDTVNLLSQLDYDYMSYYDNQTGYYVYKDIYYFMCTENTDKRIKIVYDYDTYYYEIFFITPDSEIKIFSSNENSDAELTGWNKEINEIEINSKLVNEFYEDYYGYYPEVGLDNEILKGIFSISSYDDKIEKYVEKESIQLYTNDEERKKVFPKVRVEDLRTFTDDLYKVSNITYGENDIIGIKEEQLSGQLNNYNNALYLNVSLNQSEIKKIFDGFEAYWDNDYDYDQSGGSDSENGGSSEGGGFLATTVLEFRKDIYDENGNWQGNEKIKFILNKIAGAYFIEKKIMVFDYYGDLESEKNFIVFSSNSAYAGFSGWNEQELSEYNLKDYSYYSYYWNDTHMLILNQVFSFGPFEMVEKEGVIESQKGIFQKDVTGNPDFNKPVSLKFDISKRTTISGSLKNKTIKINNLLPKERIKSILTYVWDELLNEKNDYYYSVYYYNGKNNSELKIYLSYDLQSLYVDGRTKQVDRTMIWMTKNGDLEIYNEYIKTFNESANFLNETYTYIEWDTGYANDKLKDLFYMENDGDFLSLNLDNSSPAGNGKPISHIICNGKSHPVVDADAIVYEEVE